MKYLIKKFFHRRNRNQKGAALVEFAIVVSAFLLIIMGIIEFGLLMYNQHIVTNAGREGARFGIVSRVNRVPENDIKAEVKRYTDNYLITFGGGIPTVNSGECANPGDPLTVTVDYNYNFLFLRFLAREISSTTTMRCE